MTIYFGLAIDDLFYPLPGKTQGGNFYCGQKGLLYVLETHLGRSAHSFNNNFLRIEQYRQALLLHRLENPTVFYNQSFQADQFGTAEELLSMRDELLLSGWNFSQNETLPVRLKIFSEIEGLFSDAKDSSEFLYLLPGFADRFLFILNKLATRTIPVTKIILVEPFDLLPSHFQNLFSLLREKDVEVKEHLIDSDSDDGDLWDFKKLLTSPGETANKKSLKGDGSLLILKAKRETEAAQYLAKIFEKNPEFRPLCLIPEKSRSLDNALIQEGLPSMGIQSSSLARPSLQILKLVPAFLWKPIDPFKLLEFVTLSLKPLEDELAAIIASQLAQNPGLYSESWHIAINQYFKDLEEQNQQGNDLQAEDIRKQ
ncbi:MAG: hypothetical protein GY705_10550, partial [Bacteroidetes bacterium]|nr:hypothetical protein [Bacteroidota bacterium]